MTRLPFLTSVVRFLLFIGMCLSGSFGLAQEDSDSNSLRVMTWNIWHGGREDGEKVGPERVIETIKQSQADIIAMQETYGSGELVSKGLGFHFQERGTNLSIHSRFPIIEDISVFEAFKCIGGLIELPDGHRIAFYCIWLPYGKDIWLPGVRDKTPIDQWQVACRPSATDLKKIHEAIEERLAAPKYQDISIVIAGDFNSMSHLDYAQGFSDQYSKVVDWETGHILWNAGFRDSFREINPIPDRVKDATWSPKFPEQEQDRIDFIFYKSDRYRANESSVIREHPVKFPSDHAAVVTEFVDQKSFIEAKATPLTIVSYNIKRGYGMDGQTDLARTGKAIEQMKPDLIGLQEVDFNATRSGKVNQIVELGKRLEMVPVFGKFMNFQGGAYGMGMLSRYPVRSVKELKLPQGNEPRVALVAEILLPNDELFTAVNVHFDWVKDDAYRFEQAKVVKEFLESLQTPFVLMGDFNDRPGSRTLEMFSEFCVECDKPAQHASTFSSKKPGSEIDFIFVSKGNQWKIESTEVVDLPVVSDHLPVKSKLILRKPAEKR